MAITPWKHSNSYFWRITLLKKLFWLYFLLLIFEGALRKWVLPQWSGPLLVIRDPVGLYILWEAYRTHKWPRRWAVSMQMLTVLLTGLCLMQVISGDIVWMVGLFGLRTYWLPLMVAFIMGENLDAEDLRRLGVCALFLLLPESVLAALQYISPASAFVNRGSYKGAEQITYIAGASVRASGTFSFVAGLEYFVALAGPFLVYGMISANFAKKWLLWASALSLIICIPMMGSRTVVVLLLGMIGCMVLSALLGATQLLKLLRVLVPLLLIGFAASLLPVFSNALQSMTSRFADATVTEGGGSLEETLIVRVLDPPSRAVQNAMASDRWLGIGIGRGAVAVQAFLHAPGETQVGEYEFSREFVEMGPIVGGIYELFKLFVCFSLFAAALAKAREHEPLTLLLFPLVVGTLLFGTFEEPTIGGFMVMSMAACLAALNLPSQATQSSLLDIQRQQWLNRPRVRIRVERESNY